MLVEKDVPIPKRGAILKKPTRYPFDQMDIGDSFVAEDHTQQQAKHIHTYAERCGIKTTSRRIAEKSWRVWRIK